MKKVLWQNSPTTPSANRSREEQRLLQDKQNLFFPLFVLLGCILVKIPAIPSIAVAIVTGGVYGLCVQHTSLKELLLCAYFGYTGSTDHAMVNDLLTAGGLRSMFYSVSIVILAMAFGGVMEHTGQMEILVAPIVNKVRGFVGLMTATVLTCVGINLVLPDQYIAIALPGRMYAASYDKQGMKRKDLALGIGVGGALTSALVPWNTCGIFMSGVLGVETLRYLPFAFYNYGMLFAAIIYAFIREKRKKNAAKKEPKKSQK